MTDRELTVVETGLWFGPTERRRFGWLTRPTDDSAALGVVLCPPMGEESRAAHRTFRRLGVQLAERGAVALRVDYDGTGDSVGAQDDPDRIESWLASIDDAITQLRAFGVRQIGLVGMRLGATLAATLAARLSAEPAAAPACLVLWDPCPSGRAFLREGAAVHAMSYPEAEPDGEGGVHTPGFAYSAAAAAELNRLKLADLPPSPLARHTMVLTRSERGLSGRAGQVFSGAHVDWDLAEGQPELLGVEPNLAQVPVATMHRVVDWLIARADADGGHLRRPLAVTTDPDAVFTVGDVPVRERICALGPAGLFGITTEPAAGADTPWIVLVNVAVESHIGPGRRWVENARRWAALGFRCVRVDQSGLGNSPVRPGQYEDVVFDPHWLDDLPDVIDALQASDLAGTGEAPVALFGLCSGAYSALEAAMRRTVDCVYAVNPRVSLPEMSRSGAVYDERRAVARPLASPLARLADRNSKAAWGLWRIYRQFSFWNAPMAAVMQVLRRGTTVQIVANRKDAEGFREVLWWSMIRSRSIRRTRRYAIDVRPPVDHPMMTQAAQALVAEHATAYFTHRYRGELLGAGGQPGTDRISAAGLPASNGAPVDPAPVEGPVGGMVGSARRAG